MFRLHNNRLTEMHRDASLLQLLPAALVYPARGHALPVVIVFALLFWVGSASLLGLVATIMAISWPIKYAYHLLERTALGHFDPPAMTAELVNPFSQQPLKHLAIVFALCSLSYWVYQVMGPVFAGVVLVAGLLLQPACAVVIALDDNLFAALDPRTLTGIVRALGGDYFVIAVELALAGLAVFILAGLVPRGIWFAILLYAVFATFHLIGLTIYRHRDNLGVAADVSPEREQRDLSGTARKQLNRLLDEVYRYAGSDQTRQAIDTLLAGLQRDGDRIEDHAQVHEQTLEWPSANVGLRHGQVYITRLLRGERPADAAEVYARCLKRSQDFRVESAEQVLVLARCAETLHKPIVAIHVLKDFESRFPDHADCGAVQRLRKQLSAAR